MNAPEGRANPYAPPVAPVADGGPRPFWSVMIPTYDCADYLRRTLASVLAEAPDASEMQIEVVDDCSTRDDPARVVEEIGRGRVAFYRQPRNQGAIATFNTCIARARGEWLHILHGDDLVVPGFYAVMRAAAAQRPDLGAAFCRCRVIDVHDHEIELYELEREDSGPLDAFIMRLGVWCRIQTPTIVVRRAVYEHLGGFDGRFVHAADWEMWQRIVAHYPVWYECRALACYRSHPESDSSRLARTGSNVADVRRAIDFAQRYFSDGVAPTIRRRALAFLAGAATWTAKRMRAAGDTTGALVQLRQAAACAWAAGQWGYAVRILGSAAKIRLRRRLGRPDPCVQAPHPS
jgi:hypothetical protein